MVTTTNANNMVAPAVKIGSKRKALHSNSVSGTKLSPSAYAGLIMLALAITQMPIAETTSHMPFSRRLANSSGISVKVRRCIERSTISMNGVTTTIPKRSPANHLPIAAAK